MIPIITIDGPSGTGKGTICQKLAKYLAWHMLDSGALYRVLALSAMGKKINVNDAISVAQLARHLDLEFKPQDTMTKVLLESRDVSEEIRSEACGQNASVIASHEEVREGLLQRQRDFAEPPGLVTDGRDMGTVVFPHAILKLYLDASPEERAKRRYFQLKEKGIDASLAQVVEELTHRDRRDSNRLIAPLKPADDAVVIDTTCMDVEQVLNFVLKVVNERLGVPS